MAPTYTGSCLCRSIKITLEGEPTSVVLCHCKDCQKAAGSSMQVCAVYPTDKVHTSDPKGYSKKYLIPGEQTASKYAKEKWFCSNCGSPTYNRSLKFDMQVSIVKLGILDPPSNDADFQGSALNQLVPTTEIFVKDRPSYMPAIPGAPQFHAMANDDDAKKE